MAVMQLSDGNDDGTVLGQSATDKVGLFNVTPIVQPSGAEQAAAAAQTQVSLTDNGGGTADGTVASQAAPTTLTDSTGLSGTHDDTLAAVTVPADLTGGESPTEAEHNTLLAVIRVIAQNQSDSGQKIIELVTLATTAQNNLKEVTTRLAEVRADVANIKTLQDAERTALVNLGVMKGAA